MSYDPTKIAVDDPTVISAVRFLIADTESLEISDEEITALYGETAGTQAVRNVMTAYRVAVYLKTKYSKQVSFSSAGTSVNLTDRLAHWQQTVCDLAYKLIAVSGEQPVTYPTRPSIFA